MFAPAYKLTIGDKTVDTTDEPRASTLIGLNLAMDMDTPADRLSLELGNVNGLQPEPGQETEVSLGYTGEGNLTRVASGIVARIEPGLLYKRVSCYSGADSLLRNYLDQTYENKNAGEIVRDLAQRAGVEVAAAEDGIAFPAYVIDGRRSFYRHMRDLAELCGFDLYFNPDNQLVFQRFNGGNRVHVLEYAKHILELDLQARPPSAGEVQAWGESPGSGGEVWAWLTKDFSGAKGSAGSGTPVLLLERSVLRDGTAAATAARARSTAVTRNSLKGRLRTWGRPEIKLGDAVRVRDAPEAAMNATFQVRAVAHRIDKRRGFTTTIDFRSI